ncbi:MAG: FecR family protein [bacterium]
MSGKKIIGLSVIFSLFAFAVVSYAADQQKGVVTKIYGTVEVQSVGEIQWNKVTKGMKLKINNRIKTGEKSMVVITFDDDAIATMGENSTMDILELKKDAKTSAINLRFNLWIGKLRTQVKELKHFESDFKVITPVAVIGIRGTKWGTFVEKDGTTKAIIEEGEIWIQNLPGTQRYLLKENQKVTVTPDGVVTEPQEITSEEKNKYLGEWEELPIVQEATQKKEVKPAPKQKLKTKKPKEIKKKFSLSAIVGSRMIDNRYYNELILQPEFSRGKFGIGLNILARWNDEDGFRDEDWEEVGNIINYVRWAQKGDKPLYLHLGKLSNASLGHGFIVDRYSNQGTDTSKGVLGSVLDINLKYGGLETLVNDATDPRVCGGRIYFKPLTNVDIPLVNKIIIGATYVSDTEPQLGNKNDLIIYGADFELPIYDEVLAIHLDYAKIKDFGDGIASGLGGKLQLTQINSTIGYKTEFRDLDAKFVPGFFNPLYEVTRKGTESLQETKSQKGWYVGADLDIAKLVLFSGGYEDLKESDAPILHLELNLEEDLFQLIGRRNISASIRYDHERREKKYHLIDFNAPNSTITGKINFEILENLSLSYIHQKVYDNQCHKSETSSLSTQVHF